VRRESACSDFGPCDGPIIATGTVDKVARVEKSAMGIFLEKMLSKLTGHLSKKAC
jgi:excinuclease UvrABC ATPase subunit